MLRRQGKVWGWVAVAMLFSASVMSTSASAVSRAQLRELRRGIERLEDAETAILLAAEGLALVFERFDMTQGSVGDLLAGRPPGVKELISAATEAEKYECADLRAAREAYRISQEHYQGAADAFDPMAKASPEWVDVRMLLGVARAGLSDVTGALTAFEQAWALGPSKVHGLHLKAADALFGRPVAAGRLGEIARATAVGAHLVALDTRVPPLYGYGLSYGEMGVWFGFREGELSVPRDPPAEEEEDLFAVLGDDEEEDDLFGAVDSPAAPVEAAAAPTPSAAPTTPEPSTPAAPPEAALPTATAPSMTGLSDQIGQLASLASAQAKRGDLDEADDVLQTVMGLCEGQVLDDFARAALAGAHFNLGSARLKRGQLPDALRVFQKANELDPKDAKTQYCIGVIHNKQKAYADAARALEGAVALDASLASAHFNLGTAYRKLERAADAEKAFRATLARDPAHTPAQYMLGLMAWTKGEYGEAASAWERVLEIDPGHKNAKAWLPKAQMRVAG